MTSGGSLTQETSGHLRQVGQGSHRPWPGPLPCFLTWKPPWTGFSEAGTGLSTGQGLTVSSPQGRPADEGHGVREGVGGSARP